MIFYSEKNKILEVFSIYWVIKTIWVLFIFRQTKSYQRIKETIVKVDDVDGRKTEVERPVLKNDSWWGQKEYNEYNISTKIVNVKVVLLHKGNETGKFFQKNENVKYIDCIKT